MIRYVVGFVFTPDLREVVLLRKLKPAWQRGLLNGPGGKVEEGEDYFGAMQREYAEEVGGITPVGWRLTVVMTHLGGRQPGDHGYVLHFFRAFAEGLKCATARTDEPVGVYRVKYLPKLDCVPNLRWVIPLSADPHVTHPVRLQHVGGN